MFKNSMITFIDFLLERLSFGIILICFHLLGIIGLLYSLMILLSNHLVRLYPG